jgi:shikimate 5-dehydrogenase
MTTLCGSIARRPGSLGAAMHNAGHRALGLDFVYAPFQVTDVAGALGGMRALGIRGFGVSHPHKLAVIPLLDEVDGVARRIGAVNTVVNTAGRLAGHNTDWIGAVRAIEEVRPLASTRVLLLGAGGAARAIAFRARERGAAIVICNRDDAKARALAHDVEATAVPWSEAAAAAVTRRRSRRRRCAASSATACSRCAGSGGGSTRRARPSRSHRAGTDPTGEPPAPRGGRGSRGPTRGRAPGIPGARRP